MKQLLSTILFLTVGFFSFAEGHQITGYAPDFVGKKAVLYTYQEYITMTKIKLGEAVVSEEDSLFHINLENGATFKGVLQIENTEATIYVAPETSYEIYFPPAENQPISFQNQFTDVVFFGLDTTDINYRILQYNQWFDTYVAYHETEIARGKFRQYLDTFMVYASEAYKEVKDEYFLTYVRYNIAEMQQTLGGNKKSESRLQTFLNFIEPFPVYYENDQYMKFFRGFYSKGFADYQPTIEAEINVAIYDASPTKLMAVLKQDLFLSNPEIRELVMIDQLGKQYYKRPDQKRGILLMLDSLSSNARHLPNATTAKNVLNYLTTLEPGFPAPAIKFEDPSKEDPITWKTYQGKFVYLNFFETWNEQAKTEMLILAGMQEKYGEYISFVSICSDEEKSTFDAFMKENPTINWDVFYVGKEDDLLKEYKISTVPSYFLIDQSGFIAMAPAPTPSPDGEYESIDKTFFYIKKALQQMYRH